jgi:8-oxo-dGTP pyrophosphatase MutT (NUDIX family)
MSEPKILFQNEFIEVIQNKDRVGIKQKEPSVIILPYTTDSEGNPDKIGLLSEPSPIRDSKMSFTVISGSPDSSDIDILATAKRELKEEGGYDVDDTDKWEYLGNIYTSKMVVNGNPAFGVDITGMEGTKPEGDGTGFELNSKFKLVSIKDAISNDDALISCLFLKIFQNKLL